MSSKLRSKLIRLAHASPKLRPVLLPILKSASLRSSLIRLAYESPDFRPYVFPLLKEDSLRHFHPLIEDLQVDPRIKQQIQDELEANPQAFARLMSHLPQ